MCDDPCKEGSGTDLILGNNFVDLLSFGAGESSRRSGELRRDKCNLERWAQSRGFLSSAVISLDVPGLVSGERGGSGAVLEGDGVL